jgi:hypothetical protein
MRNHQQPTTVAILGTDNLAEGILARLLEREGYAARILEAHPASVADGSLEGLDLLLLTPGLSPDVRGALLQAMDSNPKTAHIPALPVSAVLNVALLDELAASTPWPSLFEELVGQIGAALERVAAGTRALVADGGESPEGVSP